MLTPLQRLANALRNNYFLGDVEAEAVRLLALKPECLSTDEYLESQIALLKFKKPPTPADSARDEYNFNWRCGYDPCICGACHIP